MDTLSYKTVSMSSETVEKEWFIIDAKGQSLGRLASQVAKILRGKNKPTFTPHADCGDNIIVINAEKVALTGRKMTDRKYFIHSGYPGSQKRISPAFIMSKDPTKLIKMSIKGMLPKNRLGRKVLGNLYVYVGTEHKHEAQKPKELDLNSIK